MKGPKAQEHGPWAYRRGCRCDACRRAIKEYAKGRQPFRVALPPDDPRHGTESGYGYWRCRCDPCRGANTQRLAGIKRNRDPLPPDDPRHGRRSTYQNWDCRCERCSAAHSESYKAYYRRTKG